MVVPLHSAECLQDEGTALLRAPFPWFGGKSRAAALMWEGLGNVPNLVIPFAGSLAELWARPHKPGIETVNDLDGFVCNVWRAIKWAPEEVAHWADWPANENDLHARHVWLKQRREALSRRLEGDPEYYDPKIAGWWLWGIACWIGGGWCSSTEHGPWHVVQDAEGYAQLVSEGEANAGVQRQLIYLGSGGQGVLRQRIHLGSGGQGVLRQRIHLGEDGGVYAWMAALSQRLARVRVCCGDWTRILGPSPTIKIGLTGVILDPPYDQNERTSRLYPIETSVSVAVQKWAVAHGDDPQLRIVLCGYAGEHTMPDTWREVPWKANGGYGSHSNGRGRENAARERLWFSPHCLRPSTEQLSFL